MTASSHPERPLPLSSYRSSSGAENRRQALRSKSSPVPRRDLPSSPAAHAETVSLGNTLVSEGYLIEALGYESTAEGEALLVSATPAGNSRKKTAADPARRETSGLTYEEELFRAKWGWAAYDQALKAVHDPSLQETGR